MSYLNPTKEERKRMVCTQFRFPSWEFNVVTSPNPKWRWWKFWERKEIREYVEVKNPW